MFRLLKRVLLFLNAKKNPFLTIQNTFYYSYQIYYKIL
jgi:hypothetical protein